LTKNQIFCDVTPYIYRQLLNFGRSLILST